LGSRILASKRKISCPAFDDWESDRQLFFYTGEGFICDEHGSAVNQINSESYCRTLSPTSCVCSPCPAQQRRLSFRQTELRLQLRQPCGDVLPKTVRHHSSEVQQRPEHPVLMASLLLVNRVHAIGDHMYGPTELDNPVGPNLVPLIGGLLDSEAFLLIAERPSVVAVSSPE
jgi:hypothetical protein